MAFNIPFKMFPYTYLQPMPGTEALGNHLSTFSNDCFAFAKVELCDMESSVSDIFNLA